MPSRSKKPCAKHGCPNLITNTRYCKEHTSQADRYRGSSHSRGYDADWRKVRLLALARDFHLCQQCKRDGRLTPATCVDHIQPIQQAPTRRLDLSNLQSLCDPCHSRKTVLEDRGFGRAAHKETHMITIPLTPAQFAASKLKVEAELGSQLPGDNGTISHDGVSLDYHYNGTALLLSILHKPLIMPQGLIEAKIKGWFSTQE